MKRPKVKPEETPLFQYNKGNKSYEVRNPEKPEGSFLVFPQETFKRDYIDKEDGKERFMEVVLGYDRTQRASVDFNEGYKSNDTSLGEIYYKIKEMETPLLERLINAGENTLVNPNQVILEGEDQTVYGLGLAYPTGRILLLSNGEALEIKPETKTERKGKIEVEVETGRFYFDWEEKRYFCKAKMLDTPNQLSQQEGLKRFLSRVKISPKEHLDKGIALLKKYYAPKEAIAYAHDIAFIQHSYWLGIAGLTQYKFFVGKGGRGKSIRTNAICELAFKGEYITTPTLATVFRLVDENLTTLGIDELDKKLSDKQTRQEFLGLLNSGYSDGASVPRTEGDKVKEVRRYKSYGCKVFNANEISYVDTFRSRTFEEMMLQAQVKLSDWWGRNADAKREIAQYRDDCWLFALQEWEAYRKAYNELQAQAIASQRDVTIALPILASLKVLNPALYSEVEEYAIRTGQETQENIAENDWGSYLFNIILEKTFTETPAVEGKEAIVTPNKEPWETTTKELAEKLKTLLVGDGMITPEERITTQKVGRELAKLGLTKTPAEKEVRKAKSRERLKVFHPKEVFDCFNQNPQLKITAPFNPVSPVSPDYPDKDKGKDEDKKLTEFTETPKNNMGNMGTGLEKSIIPISPLPNMGNMGNAGNMGKLKADIKPPGFLATKGDSASIGKEILKEGIKADLREASLSRKISEDVKEYARLKKTFTLQDLLEENKKNSYWNYREEKLIQITRELASSGDGLDNAGHNSWRLNIKLEGNLHN